MSTPVTVDLKDLELPRSVGKVLRFVGELGALLEPMASVASPDIGRQSTNLANRIVRRHDQVMAMLPALLARHSIHGLDFRRFSFWLRRVSEGGWPERIRSEPSISTPIYLRFTPSALPAIEGPPPIHGQKASVETVSLPPLKQAARDDNREEKPSPHRDEDEPVGTPQVARRARFSPASRTAALGLGSFFLGMEVTRRLGFDTISQNIEGVEARHRPFPWLPQVPSVEDGPPMGPIVSIERHAVFNVPSSFPFVSSNPRKGVLAQQEMGERSIATLAKTGPRSMPEKRPESLPSQPLLAHLTLVAPPIRAASGKAKGAAVAFDLPLLRKGMDQLSPSRLQALRQILPPGTQALYPALPADTLGPSAVNVPLAAETINLLVTKGYGRSEPGWAESLAARAFSTPVATTLVGRTFSQSTSEEGIPSRQRGVPTKGAPSLVEQTAVLPEPPELEVGGGFKRKESRSEADPDIPSKPAVPVGAIDAFGFSVRLAPKIDSPHTTPNRQSARVDLRSTPTPPVGPNLFKDVQRRTLPHFQSVETKSPITASKKEAPMVAASPLPRMGVKPPQEPASVPTMVPPRPLVKPAHPSEEPRPTVHVASPRKTSPVGIAPLSLVSHSQKPPIGTALAPINISTPVNLAAAQAKRQGTPPPRTDSIKAPKIPAPHAGPAAAPQPVPSVMVSVEPRAVHVLPTVPAFQPMTNAPRSTSTVAKPPMPLVEKRPEREKEDRSLAVQTSKGEPAAASGPGATQASTNAAGGKGSKDAEIGLLANEVWTLLKRRLAFEAQRAGQR